MAEINYDAIRTEYLASDVTFASLAKKYGVNRTSISRKAKKDHWDDEKLQLRIRAHQEVQERTIDAQVSLTDKCITILNKMVDKVGEAVDLVAPGDVRSQKDIMSMVKDLQEMGAFVLDNGSDNGNTLTVRFENCDSHYEV